MYLFKEYLARRLFESSLPAPPGVDPEMWANPSYQKFWLATPSGREYAAKFQQAPQTPVAPAPVARALGSGLTQRPSMAAMPLEKIEGELSSYLGMQESGLLKKVPNPLIIQAIQDKINKGQIIVHENGGKARRQGAGIHFFQSPSGIAFVKNRPGASAF